jgi:hypothetical protein
MWRLEKLWCFEHRRLFATMGDIRRDNRRGGGCWGLSEFDPTLKGIVATSSRCFKALHDSHCDTDYTPGLFIKRFFCSCERLFIIICKSWGNTNVLSITFYYIHGSDLRGKISELFFGTDVVSISIPIFKWKCQYINLFCRFYETNIIVVWGDVGWL